MRKTSKPVAGLRKRVFEKMKRNAQVGVENIGTGAVGKAISSKTLMRRWLKKDNENFKKSVRRFFKQYQIQDKCRKLILQNE